MDLATFEWLLSGDGQALLAVAEDADLSDTARLRELERLRRIAGPERAAAAYEMALLRRRALAKFPAAGRMYFVREALEQSSGALVAAHRAARYTSAAVAAPSLADLCCGVGGDTLALAAAGHVTAVDIDLLRLAMAEANAQALGLAGRVAFVQADLEREAPPDAGAIFFDPARRQDGRRLTRLSEYRPPVALAQTWRVRTPAIGIKLAPGVQDVDLAAFGSAELEFISVAGELKEAVLWLGPLGQPGRRATLLGRPTQGDGDTGAASATEPGARSLFVAQGEPLAQAPLAEPGGYLCEPDPAVIRAGLVGPLAAQVGAAQIDRSIAYLTADQPLPAPFLRCWKIIEWLPFALKRLQARLRALDAGPVTVKKRGSPLETDSLARRLSGAGGRPLTVVLTFVAGKPAALVCEGAPVTG